MRVRKVSPVNATKQWFYVDIPIFHSRVLAYVGTRKEMAKTVGEATEHFLIPTANRITNFVQDWFVQNGSDCDTNGDALGFIGHGLVRVDKMDANELDDILVLNHECLHVANAILRDIELREGTNIEGLCYTHEYIFGELMRQMLNKRGFHPRQA